MLHLQGCSVRKLIPLWFGFEDACKSVAGSVAGEELLASQHFEKDDPEGPDVSAAVDFLAAGLFGAHVSCGAHDGADLGHGCGHGRCARYGFLGNTFTGKNSRQAEVQNLHFAIGSTLHVGRLEIAVDDALFMSFFKSFSDLTRHINGVIDGHRTIAQNL